MNRLEWMVGYGCVLVSSGDTASERDREEPCQFLHSTICMRPRGIVSLYGNSRCALCSLSTWSNDVSVGVRVMRRSAVHMCVCARARSQVWEKIRFGRGPAQVKPTRSSGGKWIWAHMRTCDEWSSDCVSAARRVHVIDSSRRTSAGRCKKRTRIVARVQVGTHLPFDLSVNKRGISSRNDRCWHRSTIISIQSLFP